MFSSQITMPSSAQFCVSWMSYKNCIAKGFSRLQQDGEFVDMTLAADGHLVRVHQNIVALASPYLKAMIQSAPCQHPVIFLNSVTQEMLCYILEYIYTGEVMIPTDLIPIFIETCKGLHINGVQNLEFPKKPEANSTPTTVDNIANERPPEPPENNFAAHITINSDNYNVEVVPMETNNTHKKNHPIILSNELINYRVLTDATVAENQTDQRQDNTFPTTSHDDIIDFEPASSSIADVEEIESKIVTHSIPNVIGQNLQDVLNLSVKVPPTPIVTDTTDETIPPSVGNKDKAQHYTISNRGSLQLLLNRYMYYCHHHSCGGRKRRWRCVDYRKLHCPAIIDTDNDNIVNRSEVHTHSYHDAKIMRKFKSKSVFTSLSQAEGTIKEKPPRGRSKKRLSTSKKQWQLTFNSII